MGSFLKFRVQNEPRIAIVRDERQTILNCAILYNKSVLLWQCDVDPDWNPVRGVGVVHVELRTDVWRDEP